MKRNILLIIICTVVLLSACGTPEEDVKNEPKKEDAKYEQQIKQLKEQNGELKITNAELEDEVRDLKKSLHYNKNE